MTTRYARKVIKIRAEDSPNVRYALAELAAGLEPSNERVLAGVIDWPTYQARRKIWDPIKQCVGLDAEFFEGAANFLYPPKWLDIAEKRYAKLPKRRVARAIGIDTAEGGDTTCWAVGDELGLIEMVSLKTPNTAIIAGKTIGLMKQYGVPPKNAIFDQGGGGGVHADYLREKGYPVREVSFGETVAPEPTRYLRPFEVKQDERRERYDYKNRRAQMYHLLRLRLDPENNPVGPPNEYFPYGEPLIFSLPPGDVEHPQYAELRRQLSVMPLLYDEEGRIVMLPKRKSGLIEGETNRKTLEELLGRSPDEADALVLMVYALEAPSTSVTAGAGW